MPRRIGVISDTHGLLRPEAVTALAGSELIVHAGDVGSPEVLRGLSVLAPVVAIRGNNDRDAWASRLSESEVVEIGGAKLLVIHDLADLDRDPAAAGFQVVIAGHSHRPRIEARSGVLYVNPGSAGPRRFSLPIAVAELRVRRGKVTGRIIEISVAKH